MKKSSYLESLFSLNGLTNVNIELTSRCNKGDGTPGSGCWMCGRRKVERDYPELAKWGDMDYELVKSIALQLPSDITIQFHDNGEPLLYPRLGEALSLFQGNLRCLDTNGKLLIEKAEEIIGNLDTITVSTFEGDIEGDEQREIVREFQKIKGNRKPRIIIRQLGNVSHLYPEYLIARRQFHSPMGSYEYQKPPTIPEIGICLEALSHLAIKRDGAVSMCVRFDPMGEGVIGNACDTPLNEIWEGLPRKLALGYHITGERHLIPLCGKCEYWGIPGN